MVAGAERTMCDLPQPRGRGRIGEGGRQGTSKGLNSGIVWLEEAGRGHVDAGCGGSGG